MHQRMTQGIPKRTVEHVHCGGENRVSHVHGRGAANQRGKGGDSSAARERGQAEKLGNPPPMLRCPLESVHCIAFCVWNALFLLLGF